MKIITYSRIGYNMPVGANWSWGIWKIDCIDSDKTYCMSYTVRENFGGESRLKARVKTDLGIEMIETKGIYTKTGTPKITGIATMWIAESEEVYQELKKFLTE